MSVELAPVVTRALDAPLTMQAARLLTDEVKTDTAALWAKLLRLYEGEAHTALGYSSWGEYYAVEFNESGRRGYQLLDAARVVSVLEPVNHGSTASERVAREFVPLLKDQPEEIPVVWGEVVEEHGPTPTAKQVKEVVARHATPAEPPKPEPEFTCCPTCGHRVRADKPLRPRKEDQ